MTNLALTKSKHLLPFVALLKACGINHIALLKKANLPLNCLDDPETIIPVACSGEFRKLAAQRIGDPNMSLKASRNIEIENLGKFGQVLMRGPTLHGSLSNMRDFTATESSNLIIELHPQANGDLWFGQRMKIGEWHDYLYVLNLMLKVVRLADREWSPAEILLKSKAMQHRFEAIEILGSTGRLEQENTGFFIPASMLALPVSIKPGAGDDIDIDAVNLWSSAPPDSYTASLEKMIRSYSEDRWLGIEQVSELTKSSVRTIQRRLSAEQKTYSSLIEDVRAKMAGDLLQNSDAAIADIAHHLGYRNQSSFTRAFCRWAVVSPSEFRKHRSARS